MQIENTDYREEVLDLGNPYDIKLIKNFLSPLGFDYEESSVDYSLVIYNLNDEILGTGSAQGAILKYVAVAPKYRETTVFALLITHLLGHLIKKYERVYAFTKPINIPIFEGLGFKKIAVAEPLFSVLEYGLGGIQNYVKQLKEYRTGKSCTSVASVVVNCNPITNGHLYLMEKAASENDWLYVIVVEENLSVFPFHIRWDLIKKATQQFKNITLVKGGDYTVSGKTFPSYFLKGTKITEIIEKQAELDIVIFRDYVVPALKITKRYVGEEVYCKTTAAYNKAMKKLLPPVGVEVIELERSKDTNCNFISASKIRQAIKENKLEKVKNCVPKSTWDFLQSEVSEEIRNKIKTSNSRH